MADYKTNTHSVYFTGSYLPTPILRFSGTVAFNKSTTSLEQVIMPDITAQLQGDLTNLNFSFNEMDQYSNLEYSLIQVAFGMEYEVSKGVQITADADYAKLKNNESYVYGNEEGDILILRTGVRFSF